mmetsp:Transcript_66727/g.195105  ORF Transcript_66727/g.195105 Transcript_66727/m.195105 type:complete len:403 (-) Transcript_66727:65-1273(-)
MGAAGLLQLAAALLLHGGPAAGLRWSGGGPRPEPWTIDLDLPPEERWREIVLAHRGELARLLPNIDERRQSNTAVDGVDRTQFLQFHNIDDEYLAELVGVVKWANHSEVTLERLIFWNLQYEMVDAHLCTGILAANENGMVYHGRNFDWDMSWNGEDRRLSLEDITIDVTYTRHGVPLFNSVSFVAMNGVHTGVAYGHNASWSFEQNTRFTNNVTKNLEAAKAGGRPYSFVMRSLMERSLDFKSAVREVERSKVSAAMYFIMAGSQPWQGAVVALDAASHEKSLNNVQVLSPSINRWFLVQTNDDMWTEASDDRRPEGVAFLAKMGQGGVNLDNLLVAMRTYPLFNPNTLLTTMIVPAKHYHRTWMGTQTVEIMAAYRQSSRGAGANATTPMLLGRKEWLLG